MPTTSRPIDSGGFISAELKHAMVRLLRQTVGLLVTVVAVLLLVTFAGYDAGDGSLNSTVQTSTKNPLGMFGAIVADLALQTIGAAVYLLTVILCVWGLRLMSQRWGGAWLKFACLPTALLTAAAAAAAVTKPESWPYPAGVGGFAGELILAKTSTLIAASWAVDRLEVGIGFGLLTLALLGPCLGLSFAEWRRLTTTLVSAGPPMWRFLQRCWLRGNGLGRDLWGRGKLVTEAWQGGRQEPRFEAASTPSMAGYDGTAADAEPSIDGGSRVAGKRRSLAAGPRKAPKVEVKTKAPPADRSRQTKLDLGSDAGFELPEIDLLSPPEVHTRSQPDSDALSANARMLETVLQDFGVKGEITKVRHGPVVTLYELEPAPGTKSSRVIGLADDIARSMSAISVRVAVVPGRNAIGIELPNQGRQTVFLRELLESPAFDGNAIKLGIGLGKDIGGEPVTVDLARMPHLLIAGTTGSGKSVAVNTMILSLLYRLTPEQCRFIMIDPKMLELSVYDGIPHLLSPVVTDPKKAIVALKWTVREMESRYRAMSKLGVRNIEGYNKRLAEARQKGEVLKRRVQTGFDSETGKPVHEDEPLDLSPLPFIVVVIDEVADLMLVAGKDIEGAVQRLAQMARAAGIHVIMATQRPSVDVITGTIKANFPTRISFQVTSKIDSRTILGEQGAEQLLGQGDMLYMAGGGRITRVHGPFVSDEEVEEVVAHLKVQGEPEYNEAITDDADSDDSDFDALLGGDGGGSGDELYDRAVAIVSREGKASTSFIQRHLKIGYNRAATIIEQMEKNGVVGPANHVGKREILVGDHSADA